MAMLWSWLLVPALTVGPTVNGPTGRVPLAHDLLTSLIVGDEKTLSGVRRDGRRVGVTRLASRPYVFLLRGWLTKDECEHIMQQASDSKSREEVATTAGSARVSAEWRRGCDVAYLKPSENEHLLNITRDASRLVFGREAWARRAELKAEIEHLQVLRYSPGGEFKVHWDASWKDPRACTLLYYLNGEGETWFPLACADAETARAAMPQRQGEAYDRVFRMDASSEGLRMRPQRGDALLLVRAHPDH